MPKTILVMVSLDVIGSVEGKVASYVENWVSAMVDPLKVQINHTEEKRIEEKR